MKPVPNEAPTAKPAPTPTPSGLPPLPPLMKPGLYKTRSLPTTIDLGKLQSLAANYKEDRQEALFSNSGKTCLQIQGKKVLMRNPQILWKNRDEKPNDGGIQCHNPDDNTHKNYRGLSYDANRNWCM